MSKIHKLYDDKKGFFLSLLYLQAEAKQFSMNASQEYLDKALDAAVKEMDGDASLISELRSIRLFVEKALSLSSEELSALLELLDWFEETKELSNKDAEKLKKRTRKQV